MKQIKTIKEWKKGTALLLSVLLAVPIFVGNPDIAHAAGREVRTVNLNVEANLGMKNPRVPASVDSEWEGDKVKFGQYGENPITFRVLDKGTLDFSDSGNATLFLDCDNVLMYREFNDVLKNEWETGTLCKELNGDFLNLFFSEKEKDAIYLSKNPVSHKKWDEAWGYLNYGELSSAGDKIFILDAREAEHEAYGYFIRTFRRKAGEKRGLTEVRVVIGYAHRAKPFSVLQAT